MAPHCTRKPAIFASPYDIEWLDKYRQPQGHLKPASRSRPRLTGRIRLPIWNSRLILLPSLPSQGPTALVRQTVFPAEDWACKQGLAVERHKRRSRTKILRPQAAQFL